MRQKVKKSVSILPEREEKIILEILNFREFFLASMEVKKTGLLNYSEVFTLPWSFLYETKFLLHPELFFM